MAGRTVQCFRLLLLGGRNPLLAPAGRALPARTRFVGQLQLGQWWGRGPGVWQGVRYLSEVGGGDGEGEGEEGEGDERSAESGVESGGEEHEDEDEMSLEAIAPKQHAIAPVTVPDNFPEVPILAISRNPIFPRFVKMLEVSAIFVEKLLISINFGA